ncbi:hypothetical protein N665_0022s0004 [Sinapis alba]|nr:hypothetical protein N665_0022s0004 [Sinapis alba]
MENLLGLLRLRVIRGVNLAIRDSSSSDPYVIVRMGKQKLRTRVIKKNLNPEWNEDMTLSVSDPIFPVKIMVYDRDWFSRDDKMGDAFFYIDSFLEAVKFQKQLGGLPEGAVIMKIQASRENCLSEESKIVWHKGKIIQNMFLKFQKVECGEVELQLEWIDVSGFLSMEDGGVVY